LPEKPKVIPTILKFTGPETAVADSVISLYANVADASSTFIAVDGVKTEVKLPLFTVKPTKTTTYSLGATNPAGTAYAYHTVRVKKDGGTPGDGGGEGAPTIVLTTPAATVKKVVAGKELTLSATAADDTGIAKIEFFVNEGLVCSDSEAPYRCAWKIPLEYNKKYVIKAVATDLEGKTAEASKTVVSRDRKEKPSEMITIEEPVFTPATITKKGKVSVTSSLVFNTAVPTAKYMKYYLVDSTGIRTSTQQKNFAEVKKGQKYAISYSSMIKVKNPGETYVLEVNVFDSKDKSIFKKTSEAKLTTSL
jgi:hypothetical protein